MHIGRSDIVWNYAATFLRIAGGVLLLPFILRMMSAETVGVWTVFMTVTSFINLFDFGFCPSFTRNVTYVFSGVRELKTAGYATLIEGEAIVDFGLLKGLISTMRWFYSRVSISVFLLLTTVGTYYINVVLRDYSGNHIEVYTAWFLLCGVSTCSLYTQYYEALMQGRGLVKRSKQIMISGQVVYLLLAAVLIMFKQGLIAIVAAQASSVIIVRLLSYRFFFDKVLQQNLRVVLPFDKQEIMKAIYPNAIKIGLTTLGGFAASRSGIIFGSLYLSLNQIASYGITIQLIGTISALAAIYTTTYSPKISQYRIQNNLPAVKNIYLKGQMIRIGTFITGGLSLLCLGELALTLINSQTVLMSKPLVAFALLIAFLENNHCIAGNILLAGNEVPFFKASLVAGVVTIILFLFFLRYTNLGLLGIVLAPGIAHLYNNWKWPYEVRRQLGISTTELYSFFKSKL